MNKRGDVPLWIIITLILGMTIVIFQLTGLIDIWGAFKSLFQSANNVDAINLQCRTACSIGAKYDFCNAEREVKVKGKTITGNCNSLSINHPELMIDKCSKFSCPTSSGGSGGSEGAGNREKSDGEDCQEDRDCEENLWCDNSKCVEKPDSNPVPNINGLAIQRDLDLTDNIVTSWYEASIAGEQTTFVLKKNPNNNQVTFKEYFLVIKDSDEKVLYEDKYTHPLKSNWALEEIKQEIPSEIGKWIKFYFYIKGSDGKWYTFKNSLITLWSPLQAEQIYNLDKIDRLNDWISQNKIKSLKYDFSSSTWKSVEKSCDYKADWKDFGLDPLLLLAILTREDRCDATEEEVQELAKKLNDLSLEYNINPYDIYDTKTLYYYSEDEEFPRTEVIKCWEKYVYRYAFYRHYNAIIRLYRGVSCEPDKIQDAFYVEETMYLYGNLLEIYNSPSLDQNLNQA